MMTDCDQLRGSAMSLSMMSEGTPSSASWFLMCTWPQLTARQERVRCITAPSSR